MTELIITVAVTLAYWYALRGVRRRDWVQLVFALNVMWMLIVLVIASEATA